MSTRYIKLACMYITLNSVYSIGIMGRANISTNIIYFAITSTVLY